MTFNKLIIAGCGSSGGVPRAGNKYGNWGLCDKNNIKNFRTRCSLFVLNDNNDAIVFDTSPDFRQQALKAEINMLKAVFFTHDHADQTHGIDDLRSFYLFNKKQIACYFSDDCFSSLSKRFTYLFTQNNIYYPQIIQANILRQINKLFSQVPIENLDIQPVLVNHGSIDALGFRFKNIMYTPDIKYIYQEQEEFFYNLDLWIVDALQLKEHKSHANLTDVLAWKKKFNPKKMLLTNLSHLMDYLELQNIIDENMIVAYDNMKIEF